MLRSTPEVRLAMLMRRAEQLQQAKLAEIKLQALARIARQSQGLAFLKRQAE